MSQQKYYAIVTDKGLSKLRAAAQGLGALTLSHMAFGDGNGQETAPSGTANALVNERYRAPIADKKPHPTNPSMLYVEAIIPPGVGGWTLREAGIYDTDGDLICMAKTPVMDVALLAEGATTEGLVKLTLTFDSIQSVQFFIDPTVLLATQSWVIDRIIHRPFITVESVTLTAPPASPADHALYVVPTSGAIGAWAGKGNQIAHWHGAWQFAQAPVAKVVGASDSGKYYKRIAAGWAEFLGDETVPGFLQLATDAEHKAGTRKDRATHPAGSAAAVQSGIWNFAVAGGAANALTVALAPALTAYTVGLVIRVLIAANSTGAATINVNERGAVPIKRLGGSDLRPGDLAAGGVAELAYDGTQFQVLGLSSVTTPPRNIVQFTAAGAMSWVVPNGIYWILSSVTGGGGGGGGINMIRAGGGGGAGGTAKKWMRVTPGDILTGVVGAAGSAGYTNNNGGNGGTSSLNGISATGGTGGIGSTGTAGGVGGVGSGGDINYRGGNGTDGDGLGLTNTQGGIYGGNGGSSAYGGGGRAATLPSPSVLDGVAPGSGGGGLYSTSGSGTAGKGAPGTNIIEY